MLRCRSASCIILMPARSALSYCSKIALDSCGLQVEALPLSSCLQRELLLTFCGKKFYRIKSFLRFPFPVLHIAEQCGFL